MSSAIRSKDEHNEGQPVELTDATFDALVNEQSPVLVDFWAAWCPPCRRMAPIVEEAARELAGKVVVAKLNTEENQATAMRHAIRSIPTFIVFKDGKVVQTSSGARPKAALLALLRPHLPPQEPSGGDVPSLSLATNTAGER